MIASGKRCGEGEFEGRKHRPPGAFSSVLDQQHGPAEFPNLENRFLGNPGAANVGGPPQTLVTGRCCGCGCQETGNRKASSHPEAAPDEQLSFGSFRTRDRMTADFRRDGRAPSVEHRSLRNSALATGACMERCSWAAVDTQRPRDNIKTAQKVRNFNGFDDFPPTGRSHRRPDGSVELESSLGGGTRGGALV